MVSECDCLRLSKFFLRAAFSCDSFRPRARTYGLSECDSRHSGCRRRLVEAVDGDGEKEEEESGEEEKTTAHRDDPDTL